MQSIFGQVLLPLPKRKRVAFVTLFSFSFVEMILNSRHAEHVVGCGSPVEISEYRRYSEAPTEPAGENKSFNYKYCKIKLKIMS